MNMREAIVAVVRREPDLVTRLTDALRGRIDQEQGPLATVVQAAEALEPVIADAVEKKPSRLGRLGLHSAHVLASLAAEDAASNHVLARMADNGTVGIVFVDIADFMSFTALEGDEAARALVRRVEVLVERCAAAGNGECVKSLGDGFLLAFPSGSQAVRGAASLHEAIRRERDRDPTFVARLRIAVHAGEPLVERDDLLGFDVNLTARLLDHCEPGEVIVSEAAKELAEKRLKKISFGRRRSQKIKGLASKITVYTVNPEQVS